MPENGTRAQRSMLGIGAALAMTIVAVLGLIALFTLLSWLALGRPSVAQVDVLTPSQVGNILKFNGTLVAGLGAVVALVLGYRRQKVAEAKQELDRQAYEIAQKKQDLEESIAEISRESMEAVAERERLRTLNDRFVSASNQLGHESTSVRLSGVYALAALADDWPSRRQACIDVLCGYLRMPTIDGDPSERERQVRHSIIRIIASHLQEDVEDSWQGHHFDFEPNSEISFFDAEMSDGWISFVGSLLEHGEMTFQGLALSGGKIAFPHARFAGTTVNFKETEMTDGQIVFHGAEFSAGQLGFPRSRLLGGDVDFSGAIIRSGASIDLSQIDECAKPPMFADTARLPAGVRLQ